MIRARTLSGEEVSWAQVQAQGSGPPQGLWVDVQAATPEEVQQVRDLFPLHPLALEDVLEEGHWSRFESYPAHDFITYRTLARPQDCDEFTERISIFLFPPESGSAGTVLSMSRRGTMYLETVWKLLGHESVNTPAEITYELVDHGTETFGAYADALKNEIEALQEEVFKNERLDITSAVFEHKHNLSRVRQLAAEAREAAMLLVRHGRVEGSDMIRYRDALGNLDRAVSRLDAEREGLTSLLDMSLSFQSQRMNQVMRTLTVVSTFFLPLTFLAGVWGMNFKVMPELQWRYGYALAWGSFLLTAALMALYFKRRGWW
ncbi:magnesium transporter [Deinococcus irradiatisoli]|uniref:Magnesium transporter n=1 Tax=Deinococcus irradiatisoli TaxID=2202254 RepID=A0A2Z3JH66_9DEIO|nr:magnesium transporter CorA family protein [Deinococcus irradiatisoli]AWN22299.1 magnesium transporter [Deinococcus irradiatisoli]